MIWVKSILVGLIAVTIAVVVGVILLTVALNARSSGLVSVDIVAFTKIAIVQVGLVLAFVLGFVWEYFRLRPS